jgi:uncharacterized protein (TIGR02996 family)
MPRTSASFTPPSRELLAFLACAKERPEDDAPRLVLADWLEERGDPVLTARAEFLRLQCQGPRTPLGRARQGELLGHFADTWLGPLRLFVRGWSGSRGLLQVGADARELLGGAADLPPEAFAWVEGLTVYGLDDKQATRLAGSPWLTQLNALVAPRNGLGDAGARALANSPYLAGLRTLFLRGNAVGDAGATALATSPWLGSLSVLSLAQNRVGATGARALATSPLLRRLRVLIVEGNPLGPGAADLRTAGAAHRGLWLHFGA